MEKNIGNFPEEYDGNFPEKYEIFRTIFPHHITINHISSAYR